MLKATRFAILIALLTPYIVFAIDEFKILGTFSNEQDDRLQRKTAKANIVSHFPRQILAKLNALNLFPVESSPVNGDNGKKNQKTDEYPLTFLDPSVAKKRLELAFGKATSVECNDECRAIVISASCPEIIDAASAYLKIIDVERYEDKIGPQRPYPVKLLHTNAEEIRKALDIVFSTVATITEGCQENWVFIGTKCESTISAARAYIATLDTAPKTKGSQTAQIKLSYARSDEVGKTLNELFKEDVSIISDPFTNQLFVTATDGKVYLIRDVIEKLDLRSEQVQIDALIVDVEISNEDAWNSEVRAFGKNVLGTTNSAGSAHFTNDVSAIGQNGIAFTQDKLKLFLNAVKTNGSVKVVSSPHIVTANHRPAIFEFGEVISVKQSEGIPFGGVLTSNYNLASVGISLNVTPHIHRSGKIDLDIRQDVNTVGTYDQKSALIRMNHRRIQTNLTITDGETIVLGGFIEDKQQSSRRKTPILGDIPIIKNLFNSKQNTKKKSELLLFLTPRVNKPPIEEGDVEAFLAKENGRYPNILDHLKQSESTGLEAVMASSALEFDPLIPSRSPGWSYATSSVEVAAHFWGIPELLTHLEETEKKPTTKGRCPFGRGSHSRLNPPPIRTYLPPGQGYVFRKDFTVKTASKGYLLKVASSHAAVVYLNDKLVEEDPAFFVPGGHKFEYWNREVSLGPSTVVIGNNTMIVLLSNDSQFPPNSNPEMGSANASDSAFLDIEFLGVRDGKQPEQSEKTAGLLPKQVDSRGAKH